MRLIRVKVEDLDLNSAAPGIHLGYLTVFDNNISPYAPSNGSGRYSREGKSRCLSAECKTVIQALKFRPENDAPCCAVAKRYQIHFDIDD